MIGEPARDPEQDHEPDHGKQAEPHRADLPQGQNEQRRGKGPEGGPGVAADLKAGLGETEPATRGHAADTRGLRMKQCRTDTKHRSSREQECK